MCIIHSSCLQLSVPSMAFVVVEFDARSRLPREYISHPPISERSNVAFTCIHRLCAGPHTVPVPTQWCPLRWSWCYTCCPMCFAKPGWLARVIHIMRSPMPWPDVFMRFCSLTCFSCSAHNPNKNIPATLTVASPTRSQFLRNPFYKSTQLTNFLPPTFHPQLSSKSASPCWNQWWLYSMEIAPRAPLDRGGTTRIESTTPYMKTSASTISPNQEDKTQFVSDAINVQTTTDDGVYCWLGSHAWWALETSMHRMNPRTACFSQYRYRTSNIGDKITLGI